MEKENIGFVLGFIAGEGCFTVNIKELNGSIYAAPHFVLSVNERDENVVRELRNLTELGKINYRENNMVAWAISSTAECEKFAKQINKVMDGNLFEITEKSKQLERWIEFIEQYEPPKTDDEVEDMVKMARGVNPSSTHGLGVEEWVKRNS